MRKMMKGIVAVLAVSALMAGSAFAGNDKLKVQDSTGNATVFSVQDDGITTINNKAAVDATSVLLIKDIAGQDALNFRGDGFLQVSGSGTSQGTWINYIGAADTSTNLPNARPLFEAYRLRGTKSAPAKVMPNDKLGTYAFAGYDGSGNVLTGKIAGALLEVFVDGPVSTGSVPQRMSIVTGTSSSNRAERLVVKSDGKIGIGTNAPSSKLDVVGLPVYADNAAAKAANLTDGAFYRTSTGQLMVVYTP